LSFRIRTLVACAASILALSAGQASAQETLKTSDASLETGGPMPAEQAAIAFDHADLKFKHVAKRAPWDGGFVWSQTPDGQPWVASAVQGEGCDLFWPCIDHPTGKAKLVDEHITVPARWSRPATASPWAWTRRTAGAPITGARKTRAPTASRSTSRPTSCCPANTAAATAT
jgi:hypothetical protein